MDKRELKVGDHVKEQFVRQALESVFEEIVRARQKFPDWPLDPLHAIAILNEEVGELNQELLESVYKHEDPRRNEVAAEAIQVAAMAVEFLLALPIYDFKRAHQSSRDQLTSIKGD